VKKNEIRIGETYVVKVSGKLARVRVTGESPYGGWVGQNLATRREVRIRSAQRLRRPAGRPAEQVFRGASRRALAENRCENCGKSPVVGTDAAGTALCADCFVDTFAGG